MARGSARMDLATFRPRTARAWERGADGHVVLLVPKFDGAILGRFLQPRLSNPWMWVHLDEMGSAVWECCDGSRTVEELAGEMSRRFPSAPGMPERVREFVLLLRSQGHVA